MEYYSGIWLLLLELRIWTLLLFAFLGPIITSSPSPPSSSSSSSSAAAAAASSSPRRRPTPYPTPPQASTIVKMASIMEGPLSKWTNVMKGWQYRWFVLDYNAGLLSYYTVRSFTRSGRRWTEFVQEGRSQKLSLVDKPKWDKGLVFVRSWESQLAQRGESLRDRSPRRPIATILQDQLTNRVAVFVPHFR